VITPFYRSYISLNERNLAVNSYDSVCGGLRTSPKVWLVTGAAGFIGSNLAQRLLELGQAVIAVDNFSTGHQRNLDEIRFQVGAERWARLDFVQGDLSDASVARSVMYTKAGTPVDFVLHQAALGSVPRSIQNPLATNAANITAFLNVIWAAKEARVGRFVFAASSSTYGDHPGLPKREDVIGRPLSPYAVTKYVNELYADVFSRTYGLEYAGLRYFNVFGPRQDPFGPYAAVIPKWIAALLRNENITMFGDGESSRDFCYVENVVQANVLAAAGAASSNVNRIFNVAVGDQTSLNQLLALLREELGRHGQWSSSEASYKDFRAGDVRHSLADIARARDLLGYAPTHSVRAGLSAAMPWYLAAERQSGSNGTR
jgi:UDP-N-acetylglucosamine 4-epimerase